MLIRCVGGRTQPGTRGLLPCGHLIYLLALLCYGSSRKPLISMGISPPFSQIAGPMVPTRCLPPPPHGPGHQDPGAVEAFERTRLE